MESEKPMPNNPATNEPQWYLLVRERELGLFNLPQIRRFANKGMLTRESTLRNGEDDSRVAKTEYLAVLGHWTLKEVRNARVDDFVGAGDIPWSKRAGSLAGHTLGEKA